MEFLPSRLVLDYICSDLCCTEDPFPSHQIDFFLPRFSFDFFFSGVELELPVLCV